MRDVPVEHIEFDDSWMPEAACRGRDTDLWMPRRNDDTTEPMTICHTQCSVRQQCLNYALITVQKKGIWGGTTEGQRVRLRRAKAFAYTRMCRNTRCSNTFVVRVDNGSSREFCSAACAKQLRYVDEKDRKSEPGYWDWVKYGNER